jgi:putative transcriptional regulator
MNTVVIAKAIEADAGEAIPGLRDSLAEMAADERGRTHTPEQIALREARVTLGLSQPAFARLIDTPVKTVRDWEQGRFPPPGAASAPSGPESTGLCATATAPLRDLRHVTHRVEGQGFACRRRFLRVLRGELRPLP